MLVLPKQDLPMKFQVLRVKSYLDILLLFVQCSLWRCIKGSSKQKYSITGIFLHRSVLVLKEDDTVLGAAVLAFDGSDYTECYLEEYDAIQFTFFQNVCQFLPYCRVTFQKRLFFKTFLVNFEVSRIGLMCHQRLFRCQFFARDMFIRFNMKVVLV